MGKRNFSSHGREVLGGTGPRTNSNGTTGWVVMHARSSGLPAVSGRSAHICAHDPCKAPWAPAKHGLYPAPMHVRLCDWIPPEAAAIAPAAAVAAASEVAPLEPAAATDAADIAANSDIPSAPAAAVALASPVPTATTATVEVARPEDIENEERPPAIISCGIMASS